MDRTNPVSPRFGLAAALIAAGALLLLARFYDGFAGSLWPAFIIVPGLVLLIAGARTNWQSSLTVSGAIVVAVGLILLIQNTYDYYRSWAYAWALLPLAGGAALYYSGLQRNDTGDGKRGLWIMQWSSVAFLALGALFELLLFDGGHSWAGYAIPLALIAGGVLLLMRRGTVSSTQRSEDAAGSEHRE